MVLESAAASARTAAPTGALALDEPLALLYALVEAARLPTLPRWAEEVVAAVRTGALERSTRRALAIA
jgi:hypothetical protein